LTPCRPARFTWLETDMTLFKTIAFIALFGALAACSTIEGAGHDISDTARWARQQM
jgi:predicted small secreted protein